MAEGKPAFPMKWSRKGLISQEVAPRESRKNEKQRPVEWIQEQYVSFPILWKAATWAGSWNSILILWYRKKRAIYTKKIAANIKSSATSSQGVDRLCKPRVGGSSGLRVTYVAGVYWEKLEILQRYFTDICAYTGMRGVDRDWKKCSSGLLGSNNVKWRILTQGSLLCFLISNSVSFLYASVSHNSQ